jgi:UDP-glucose 4-epimerase
MRILVTGGNGSLGRELVPALLAMGHEVAVLDRELDALRELRLGPLTLVKGLVEDRDAVEEAIRGADAVIHMAWSFADDPAHLVEHDLYGHQLLLDAARANGVRHVVYTSTAVVYGKPLRLPIDENHPLRVLEARKPSYGLAKEFAEKLTLLSARTGGPPATILRFWWAFGGTIGGRHLRDMLRTAAEGTRLTVPAECGGSFLSMDDFVHAVSAVLFDAKSFGETFNLASAYVTWAEVARMVVAATGSSAAVDVVSRDTWTGPAFLADVWQLDDRRIRERLGVRPRRDPEGVRGALASAIEETWAGVAR